MADNEEVELPLTTGMNTLATFGWTLGQIEVTNPAELQKSARGRLQRVPMRVMCRHLSVSRSKM